MPEIFCYIAVNISEKFLIPTNKQFINNRWDRLHLLFPMSMVDSDYLMQVDIRDEVIIRVVIHTPIYRPLS